MNPQNYTINIRPGWGISPVVKVSQGDVGRPLAFTIMDGQDALTIASGTTITIKGTKPSTLGFTQACELSGNTASVETTATMTQEAGAVQAELILTQGTTVIGSANFVMYVEPAAHPEGTTDGDAETARDLMTRAEQAVEQAETAAQSASDSAASIAQAGIDASTATSGQVPTANGSGGWNWADQEGSGGGTSDDIENASSVTGTTVSDALDTLSDEIATLSGGAPTPAATVSAMVDTSKIYLYTGSETGYNAGHWYYYSGSQWVDGGAYGEAASMSAGVKSALLACFQHVAWVDEHGQTYYDNLYNELYPPASLVSITATYTQSGTVYDTASLDDLKPDLVVTANYSDSTSETVTTYTLSGTLATGTSTITVSYGGKTATFSVTVAHERNYTTDGLQGYWTFDNVQDGYFGELTNHSDNGDLKAEAVYAHNAGDNAPLSGVGVNNGEFISTTSKVSSVYTNHCPTAICVSTIANYPAFYTAYPYSVEWYGKFVGSKFNGTGYDTPFAYATGVSEPILINTRNSADPANSVFNMGGQGTVVTVQDGAYKTYGAVGQGNNTIAHSGMTPENYHHYVITVAKTSIKIYVDGELIGEGTATNNNNASASYGLLLGMYTAIKMVRVYNKILSAEEVATNYSDIDVA